MTNHLEEQLMAGMREQVADVRLTDDILDAAARRHHRRTLVQRATTATGVVGLVAMVAVAAATAGQPPRGTTPGPAGAVAGQGQPMVTVGYVSTQTSAVLAKEADKVEHVTIQVSQGTGSSRSEFWYDATTRTERFSGVGFPGLPREDYGVTRKGSTYVETTVDFEHRVWWTRTGTTLRGPSGGLAPSTPASMRDFLRKGGFVLAGRERLDGKSTLHLRLRTSAGDDELWVDAGSYEVVRRVIVKNDAGGTVRIQEDFRWMARTPQALAELTVVPPAGFNRVSGPSNASPAPQPSR